MHETGRFPEPFGQFPLGQFSRQSPMPQERAKLPICRTMLRSCSHCWSRLSFLLCAPDLGVGGSCLPLVRRRSATTEFPPLRHRS
jgi:hypothetical protein